MKEFSSSRTLRLTLNSGDARLEKGEYRLRRIFTALQVAAGSTNALEREGIRCLVPAS